MTAQKASTRVSTLPGTALKTAWKPAQTAACRGHGLPGAGLPASSLHHPPPGWVLRPSHVPALMGPAPPPPQLCLPPYQPPTPNPHHPAPSPPPRGLGSQQPLPLPPPKAKPVSSEPRPPGPPSAQAARSSAGTLCFETRCSGLRPSRSDSLPLLPARRPDTGASSGGSHRARPGPGPAQRASGSRVSLSSGACFLSSSRARWSRAWMRGPLPPGATWERRERTDKDVTSRCEALAGAG